MKKRSVKKKRVHTSTFGNMDEPQDIIDKRLNAMNEKLSEMKEGQDMAEKKKKVEYNKITDLTDDQKKELNKLIDDEENAATMMEKFKLNKVSLRNYILDRYMEKNDIKIEGLRKSEEKVKRGIVWSDVRGIMVSVKKVAAADEEALEYLKGGITEFDLEVNVNKKKKEVTLTLTGKNS